MVRLYTVNVRSFIVTFSGEPTEHRSDAFTNAVHDGTLTCHALPSLGSSTYQFTITPQIQGPTQTFRFYIDYTFFNPFDEQDAWVYLQNLLLTED